jgi:uncharacterized RDD family membrane protein YckC
MAIVVVTPSIVPPPPGVDVTDSEALRQSIHLFEPRHFAAPFLAHALGTLAGSFVAFVLAASSRSAIAYLIGAVFFAGGVAASIMIPAPLWFVALDLAVAYFPMSYLGKRLGDRVHRGDRSGPPQRSAA